MIFWDLGGVIVQNNVNPAFQEAGIPYDAQAREAWRLHRIGRISQQEFYEAALRGTAYAKRLPELKKRADELIELQPGGVYSLVKKLLLKKE